MDTIDEYIAQYPANLQEKLQEVRTIIRNTAPDATEKISWGMPTFFLNGNLIHFAMNKAHIGIYPGPSSIQHFQDQLGDYKYSKGAIQFSLNKPLPKKLIADIVTFRIQENSQK